jgi:hypothetical protein
MVRKHKSDIAKSLDAGNQDIYNSNVRIQQATRIAISVACQNGGTGETYFVAAKCKL